MTVRAAGFKVMGMNRDLSESAFNSQYAYENMNMRVTNTDNNTLLSLSNERGNKAVVDEDGDAIVLLGLAIGYAVLDNILIVFTHQVNDSDNPDHIYRLTMSSGVLGLKDYEVDGVNIDHWQGDIGFDSKHPIETLISMEADKVKKVYWVDGINPMRFINVAIEKMGSLNPDHFNFVPTLTGSESVTVERIESSLGTFPSGCIQYFFTYYNKYGQESGIFYATTLLYTSPPDRGGTAEEKATCYFNITLTGLDISFDYVRVYAIHRTSLNGEVSAYQVKDVLIDGNETITVNDYGTSLTDIASTDLLYKSRERIIGSTMTQKDQRLFVGNVSLDEKYELTTEIKKFLQTYCEVTEGTKQIPYVAPTGVYPYQNNLELGEAAIKSFKGGDWYRIAVQLQSETGVWTEPVYIGDYQVRNYPYVSEDEDDDSDDDSELTYSLIVPTFNVSLTTTNLSALSSFIKIRALIAQPLDGYKSIMCQGVLCPTLYQLQDRYNNAPYSVASWIMRPIVADVGTRNIEFRHNYPLPINSQRNGEIQLVDNFLEPYITDDINIGEVKSVTYKFELTPSHTSLYAYMDYTGGANILYYSKQYSNPIEKNGGTRYDKIKEELIAKGFEAEYIPSLDDLIANAGSYIVEVNDNYIDYSNTISNFMYQRCNNYYVDQSVLTFHSPDINDNTQNKLNDTSLNLRIIGIVPITANYSDYYLDIEGSRFNPDTQGLLSINLDNANLSYDSIGFINAPIWNDSSIKQSAKEKEANPNTCFAVYLWHRNGSLNDDYNGTGDDKYTDSTIDSSAGSQFSVLSRKIISNLRFAYDTKYFVSADGEGNFSNIWEPVNGISNVEVFNSDEISLLKLKSDLYSNNSNINYYGNVDTLLSYPVTDDVEGYKIQWISSKNYNSEYIETSQLGKDPVSIKYKSTPHIALALNSTLYGTANILPSFSGMNVLEASYGKLPWMLNSSSSNVVLNYLVTELSRLQYVGDDDSFQGTYYCPGLSVGDYVYTEGVYIEKVSAVYDDGSISLVDDSMAITSGTYWYYGGSIYIYNYTYNEGGVGGTSSLELVKTQASFTASQDEYYVDGFDNVNVYSGFLYLAELYREAKAEVIYGGTSDEELRKNTWTVNSKDTPIDAEMKMQMVGDTFFGRWDCMKTYPFTTEDTNQVVDITSFLVESSINLDGRTDKNRGQKDNTLMSPENFNLWNDVYNQENNYFSYQIQDDDITQYDFHNSIIWSELKTNGELIDTWANIMMSSFLDMDSAEGEVTSLNRLDNNIICLQQSAVSEILYNESTQVASSTNVPIEIANSGLVSGKRTLNNGVGCYNKWTVVETPNGIYFVDDYNRGMYMINSQKQINVVSDTGGFHSWFNKQIGEPTIWNPEEFYGMVCHYDARNQDVNVITSERCLAYSERLGGYGSFYSYEETPYFVNIRNQLFTLKGDDDRNTTLWQQNEGEYNSFFGEQQPYWTTVVVNGDGTDQSTFRTNKIFNNLEFRADSWDNEGNLLNSTFDYLNVWNEYQQGQLHLNWEKDVPSELKRKFRIWRALIPRDNSLADNIGYYGRHGKRMMNPWLYVQLIKNSSLDYERTVLHDLTVYYTEAP